MLSDNRIRVTVVAMLVWLGGIVPQCTAQVKSPYTPLQTASPRLDSILSVLKAAQTRRMAAIDPKKQNLLHDAMTERYAALEKKFKETHFFSDDRVDPYLQGILREILKGNPTLPAQDIRLLLARYPWPNATSHGEGTILLNAGLLAHLENESQLAFVICHEIAHYVLDHVESAIRKRIAVLESDETKAEIKKISKTEYGARAKALELLKDISYDATRHSRLREAQADSMALSLLLNTRYDAREALSCLGILDHIDEDDSTRLQFRELLDSKDFPFNDAWLRVQLSSFGGATVEKVLDEDSLKTHPDCGKRIALLVPRLEDFSGQGKSLHLQSNKAFLELRQACTFEAGRSHYFFDNLSRALYEGILLLQRHPDQPFLQGTLGMCLTRMHNEQKNHALGKYIDLPSRDQSEQYVIVTSFIQNLRLSDWARLGYYFLKPKAGDAKDPYLLYAWWASCRIMADASSQVAAKERYLQLFPNGEFAEEINSAQ